MPAEAGVLDDWVQSVSGGARKRGARPRLNSEFAPLFTRAVYESVQEMEVLPLHLGIVYEMNAAKSLSVLASQMSAWSPK